MDTIGKRVYYARERRGLTQDELARHSGVTQQTIFLIEADKIKRSKYLPEIAQVLRVRWEWLLEGVGQMDRAQTRKRPKRRRGGLTQEFARFLD